MGRTADTKEMILQNWWFTTLLNSHSELCPPLMENISCDVVVIGAGMAGLAAAHRLVTEGKKVVVLDRNICGGGSTGKSAGFLTPDSELELSQLVRRYGKDDANLVWGMAAQGVELLVKNIRSNKFSCDLQEQDSLFLGIGRSGRTAVEEEAKYRDLVGYPSKVYNEKELKAVNAGRGYSAGIRYGDTFGINPLLYCQEMKRLLLKKGVKIYESTTVTQILGHKAKTHMGTVEAKNIIVCVDKMRPSLNPVASQVYHAQTFLSISEPLTNEEIQELFPEGSLLCWDSKLVYSYYRLTGDKRLLLGGGSALTTFTPFDVTPPTVIGNVIKDFKKRFPFLQEHEFIQYWPGRIDTTKDLIPIVDRDPEKPHVQYLLGCVGLPWATFCGDYAARKLLEPKLKTYDKFLTLNRQFLIPLWIQAIIGKMGAFSLNNIYSKYVQRDISEMMKHPEKDTDRKPL